MTRLAEPLEGKWWLPGDRRKARQGFLQQLPAGDLELTLRKAWQFDVMKNLYQAEHLTLLGEDSTGRLVSLTSGFLKTFTLIAPEASPAIFYFNLAFIGVHFPGEDRPFLTELSARIPALDNWLGISGLTIERPPQLDQTVIRFSPPENLELEIEPGLKLAFEFGWRGPTLRRTQLEAHIQQEAWLTLRSVRARTHRDLATTLNRILNLFSLLTGEALGFEFQLAKPMPRRSRTQKPGPRKIEILFAPVAPELIGKAVEEHDMLLRFKDIQSSHPQFLQRWLERYRVCAPAFDSYFAAQRRNLPYIEERFLSIVRSLETLHRLTTQSPITEKHQKRLDRIQECCPEHWNWLVGKLRYSHEPALSDRLVDLLKPFGDLFGDSQERRRLAESTMNTRNYLTHYDPKIKDRAVEPSRLTPYIFRLKVLFVLRCLLELGLTPDEARQHIEKHDRLRQEVRFGKI